MQISFVIVENDKITNILDAEENSIFTDAVEDKFVGLDRYRSKHPVIHYRMIVT